MEFLNEHPVELFALQCSALNSGPGVYSSSVTPLDFVTEVLK